MTFEKLLSHFPGARKPNGQGGYLVHCPVHGPETKPSLSVSPGNGNGPLFNCFAGCDTGTILAAVGMGWQDVLPPKERENVRRPTAIAALRAKEPFGEITRYQIRDESGNVVAVHLREDFSDGEKTFKWQLPDGTWGLGGRKCDTLPLYGIDRLPTDAIEIVIAEGEKTTDALLSNGIPAVGTVTGAAGTPVDDALRPLLGRQVFLWPDNDEPGRRHMDRIGAALLRLGNRKVRVIDWTGAPEKGDAADLFELEAARDDFDALMDGARPFAGVDLEEIAPSFPGGNGQGKALTVVAEMFNLTDAGNAKRLVAHLSRMGRYCYPFKAWYLYDGKRWGEDKTGAIFAAAKGAVKGIYAEAQTCGDDSTRKAIAAHAVRSETERALKAMIALAQSEPDIPVSPSDFDQHPDLLNCLNGTASLRAGKIKPHDPADLLTQMIPISFDEDAPRERWKQFLNEVFQDRQELIDYLQRLIGFYITGLTAEQVFAIFHGSGANGKSTLLDVLLEVFADYMTTTPFSTFAVQRNQGIRNDLADLHNVRIVATSESSEGQLLNEELIKRATGDATIKSRFLFKEFFSYKRKFKIIMSVNHLPKIRGTDHAIWRRVRCIPFDNVFEGENCDLNLKDKLLAEAPGILAWAVLGSMLWHDMGLGCPDAVKAATAHYKEDEDTLGCFLKECCDLDPTHTQAARPLYLSYRDYCGGKTVSEKAFSKNMENRGYKKETKKTGVIWNGLELLPGRTAPHGPKGEG